MLCLGVSLGQQKTAQEERKVQYDTPGIRLEGRLTERKVYGPPGYGETPTKDKQTTILVLKLPYPITVEPSADAKQKNSPSLDPVRNVHEVQLFIARHQTAGAHALLGKRVVAEGTLSQNRIFAALRIGD